MQTNPGQASPDSAVNEGTANQRADKSGSVKSGSENRRHTLPGLYAARVRAGMDGQQVATLSGVNHTAAMSKLERGIMEATPARLKALAIALGVSEKVLLEAPGEMAPEGVPEEGFRGTLKAGDPGAPRSAPKKVDAGGGTLLKGLHAARVRAGMECSEVARRTGVDEATVGRIERSLEPASAAQIHELAKALGVDRRRLVEERKVGRSYGDTSTESGSDDSISLDDGPEEMAGSEAAATVDASTGVENGITASKSAEQVGREMLEGSGNTPLEEDSGDTSDGSRGGDSDGGETKREAADTSAGEEAQVSPAPQPRAPESRPSGYRDPSGRFQRSTDTAARETGSSGQRQQPRRSPTPSSPPPRRDTPSYPPRGDGRAYSSEAAKQQLPQRAKAALDAVIGDGEGMLTRGQATRLLEEIHAIADKRGYNGGVSYQQALASVVKEQILVGRIMGPEESRERLAAFSRDSYSHL